VEILVATDQWFPDFKGGSARVAAVTAACLAARGHAVTVLAPAVRGLPSEEQSNGITLFRAIHRYGIPQTVADAAAAAYYSRRLRSRRVFEVAIAHQVTVGTGLLAARIGAPVALVYHASASRELEFRRRAGGGAPRVPVAAGMLDLMLRALERYAVDGAATIMGLSDFTCALVAQDHPHAVGKLARVSGGVDETWFSPDDGPLGARRRLGVPAARQLLVAARRLEPRMGLERLLEALRLLPGVELVIIGDGPLRRTLNTLAGQLRVIDRVRFHGSVSEASLRDWYRAADIVVLPTVAYEGFGLVTAEALACGTPVVGTPVGATPELLVPLDPELVTADATADSLAAAIRDVLPRVTCAFRERCRTYAVSRFAWQVVADEWERILLSIARA
jgi:glycosyltransferase involved in cell wall biosynthesis